jgi:hypothetical protein
VSGLAVVAGYAVLAVGFAAGTRVVWRWTTSTRWTEPDPDDDPPRTLTAPLAQLPPLPPPTNPKDTPP